MRTGDLPFTKQGRQLIARPRYPVITRYFNGRTEIRAVMYTNSPLYIPCYGHQTANQNELTASSQVNHCPGVHVAHVNVTDIRSSHSRQYVIEHNTIRTWEWVLLLSRNCGSIGVCGKG